MDTKTPIKLKRARLARAPAAGALCALALSSLLAPPHAVAQVTTQQAVLLYTRITGVPPSPAILSQITTDVTANNPAAVATLAVSQPQFYNVTLRNIFAAESN